MPDYEALAERLARAPQRVVPAVEAPLPAPPDLEVPGEDTVREVLRQASPRVGALALALAGDLAYPDMWSDRISGMFVHASRGRDAVAANHLVALRLSNMWSYMHMHIWAFTSGDEQALDRIAPQISGYARWAGSAGEEEARAAWRWAPGHVTLVSGLATTLLDWRAHFTSPREEQRQAAGALLASYLFALLRDIPVVRRGVVIHRVQHGTVMTSDRQREQMRREWWAHAMRRIPVREGLHVELE